MSEQATAEWRSEAARLDLPGNQIDLMADAYETPQRQAARVLARG
jgi:crotonobetainyl-CoA:carnitine CoA-transferase CaiB-like acyl-CoA transferase